MRFLSSHLLEPSEPESLAPGVESPTVVVRNLIPGPILHYRARLPALHTVGTHNLSVNGRRWLPGSLLFRWRGGGSPLLPSGLWVSVSPLLWEALLDHPSLPPRP